MSGNISEGHTTPPRNFSNTYKQKRRGAEGRGYTSPGEVLDAAFNGGIGFTSTQLAVQPAVSIYKTGRVPWLRKYAYDKAKSYLKMYVQACLLSIMTFREQSKKSASPPSRAPGRQRHQRSQRLPRQAHRRSRKSVCRGTVPVETLPSEAARHENIMQRKSTPASSESYSPSGPDYGSACLNRQPSPNTEEEYGPAFGTPQSSSAAGRASATEPPLGGAEPQGNFAEAVDFSSEFIDKWKKTIL